LTWRTNRQAVQAREASGREPAPRAGDLELKLVPQ
jgi:hypothetical protein